MSKKVIASIYRSKSEGLLYWEKIKSREFSDFQSSPNWGQLKLESLDGEKYNTDCANTEGIFRIIQ